MKVLDPQSALLTNAEVYHFIQNRPKDPPEKKVGAYPQTNLSGFQAILKDFNSYVEETTPHVKKQIDIQDWIGDVVSKLKPYGLTKTEVMNLINIGVGTREVAQPAEDAEADGDVEVDGERDIERYVQDFMVVVEEVDVRFPGETGQEQIREIVTVLNNAVMKKEMT